MRVRALLAMLALVAGPGAARADVIELANGTRVEGTIIEARGSGIVIKVRDRDVWIRQDRVRSLTFASTAPAPPLTPSVAPPPSSPRALRPVPPEIAAALSALDRRQAVTARGLTPADYAARVDETLDEFIPRDAAELTLNPASPTVISLLIATEGGPLLRECAGEKIAEAAVARAGAALMPAARRPSMRRVAVIAATLLLATAHVVGAADRTSIARDPAVRRPPVRAVVPTPPDRRPRFPRPLVGRGLFVPTDVFALVPPSVVVVDAPPVEDTAEQSIPRPAPVAEPKVLFPPAPPTPDPPGVRTIVIQRGDRLEVQTLPLVGKP